MSDDEIATLVSTLAQNPAMGDEIQGTGGCRKLRWAKQGQGKRGGYRIITFFSGVDMPLYLLTLFAKGEKANLTEKEKATLKSLTKQLVEAHHQNQSHTR
jgi:hypothetical protein